MPNSTTPRSTSASPRPTEAVAEAPLPTVTADGDVPPLPPHDPDGYLADNPNIRLLADLDEAAEPTAPPPAAPEPTPVSAHTAVAAPTVTAPPVVAAPVAPRPTPPTPAPLPSGRMGNRRRSARVQWRFVRTLGFALQLLLRVLWWQWLVQRVMGEEYVRQGALNRWQQYAREFRNFAASMGGVMIKLGQFISTRADIFPEQIINELAGLQDEIPAVSFAQIRAVLERELGDVGARFKWLREEPIAAASLGQVHRAQLHNGDRVVVKVQRPGIDDIISTDMAALKIVARVANRFRFINRRADAVAITEEFGRVLWEEVSYRHEAENARRFAAMFANNLGVYVPAVYEDHSTDRVLTMEDVTSIKISDYDALERAGIKRSVVAKRLINTYLQQIFDDRFFHADPHPGNLFIYPLPVPDGQREFGPEGRPFYLIFIDFGMSGTLTQQIVDGLISTLVAVVTRDARRLVQSYQQLNLLLPGADTERLIEATKATFDQVWGLNMNDLANIDQSVIVELGTEFTDLLFDMPFQMPQNFIYLSRTIGILSGICTTLDPTFNVWLEIQPYAQKLMRQQSRAAGGDAPTSLITSIFGGNGLQALLSAGLSAGQAIVTRAVDPAGANADALTRALQRGDLKIQTEPSRKLQFQLQMLEVRQQTTTRAMIFAGLLISSTLLLVNDFALVAWLGYALTALVGWRVVFPPGLLK